MTNEQTIDLIARYSEETRNDMKEQRRESTEMRRDMGTIMRNQDTLIQSHKSLADSVASNSLEIEMIKNDHGSRLQRLEGWKAKVRGISTTVMAVGGFLMAMASMFREKLTLFIFGG